MQHNVVCKCKCHCKCAGSCTLARIIKHNAAPCQEPKGLAVKNDPVSWLIVEMKWIIWYLHPKTKHLTHREHHNLVMITMTHTHTDIQTICSDPLGPRSRVEALHRVHTPPACTDCRNAASFHRTVGRNLQDNRHLSALFNCLFSLYLPRDRETEEDCRSLEAMGVRSQLPWEDTITSLELGKSEHYSSCAQRFGISCSDIKAT